MQASNEAKKARKREKRKAKRAAARALREAETAGQKAVVVRRAPAARRNAVARQRIPGVGDLKKLPPAPFGIRKQFAASQKNDIAWLSKMMDRGQIDELLGFVKQLLILDSSNLKIMPRGVPAKVSPFPEIITMDVFYDSSLNAQDPRLGLAGYEKYRSALFPIHIWKTLTPIGVVNFSCRTDGMSALTGLWPGNGNPFDENFETNVMELDNVDTTNIVGLWKYSDLAAGLGVPARKFKVSDGTFGFGVPLEVPTSLGVNLNLNGALKFPTGMNIEMRLVSVTGVTGWVAGGAAASSDSQYQKSYTFATARSDLGGQYSCVMPDAPMGIQIRCSTGTVYISTCEVTFSSAGGITIGRMEPVLLPYADDVSWGNQFSCDGLHVRYEYDGSDLKNGGQIAQTDYPGGVPMTLAGYTGYNAIASLTEKYLGPLKTGSYDIWKPYVLEDLEFLNPEDFTTPLTRASSACWLRIADVTQQRALKLILTGATEGTTKSPTRETRQCRINPLAQTIMIGMIQHYPACTENPLHWKDIKTFLAKLQATAKGGYEWYNDNKAWIVPAATALAALA